MISFSERFYFESYRNDFLPAMKAIMPNGNKLMSITNGATTCSRFKGVTEVCVPPDAKALAAFSNSSAR